MLTHSRHGTKFFQQNELNEKTPQPKQRWTLCEDKKSHRHTSSSRAAYLQKSARERTKTIQKPFKKTRGQTPEQGAGCSQSRVVCSEKSRIQERRKQMGKSLSRLVVH
jgi:hypothetical protein